MEKITTAIIGGGAAGLVCAAKLDNQKGRLVVFEKLDRVGKKLSATGNGQGNLSHEKVGETAYFSIAGEGATCAKRLIARYGKDSWVAYIRSLGGLCLTDERGRIYPASRQASSLTDLLRAEVSARGVEVKLSCAVQKIERAQGGFLLFVKEGEVEKKYLAETVVLCAGGKAAKNFGTDGGGYALAKGLGHSVTATYPSLVQIKTETKWTKTLKGIRVQDCSVSASFDGEEISLTGDVIFTEYGLSGDAIFRLSAYIADKAEGGNVKITLDFAPSLSVEELSKFLQEKQSKENGAELLCGVVNNQIGRAVLRRAEEEKKSAAQVVKQFILPVTGTLGYDYAQVTKGGVPLVEVDENLQSKKAQGLYFAGEILDVDGPCGGFNIQWAYASACAVAVAIDKK